ncbi:MAG TPA: ABC transporter permease, partial [Pseudoneobacillus sp.]|nr:ABC transporter permease [Pseudoneobacillus sp.]
MKAYWQLTLAQLRIFLRNRQVLIWTLVFPILLMTMLGSFLGQGNGLSLTIGVVDKDHSSFSSEFVKQLNENEAIDLEIRKDEKRAPSSLKKGDLQLVVIVPKDYESNIKNREVNGKPFAIPVYFN